MSTQALYVARIQRHLDELNAQIGKLDARARHARLERQDPFQTDMRLLRAQARQAGEKLDELRSAAEGTWRAQVADMERLRREFSLAFFDLRAPV